MKSFVADAAAAAADAASLKLVEMNDFSTCTFPFSHFQVPSYIYKLHYSFARVLFL